MIKEKKKEKEKYT